MAVLLIRDHPKTTGKVKIHAPFCIRRDVIDGRLFVFGFGVVRRFFLKRGTYLSPDASGIAKSDIVRTQYTWGYRIVAGLPDSSHGSSGDPRA